MCFKEHYQENMTKPQNGRKYSQIKNLICNLYPEYIHGSLIKRQVTHLKMGKGFEQTFLQKRYTNDQQAHEKMLNITVIRKMQIKTSMRYQVILPRIGHKRKKRTIKVLARRRWTCIHGWWACKME